MVGTTPVTVIVTARPTGVSASVATGDQNLGFYTATGPGLATLRPNGASISADVATTATADKPAQTLHIEGDATCATVSHQ